MTIVIAQLKHETKTFSPVPTPLSRFTRVGETPPCGEAAIREYRNTGSAIAAMIDRVEEA
ncbi:MAG: microcystin degradation protein MlrC, partial [Betaproteobacteria bacterium]|nr:microcystin degradation protein MlrC [Betaproteobacteria bacterium]